MLGYDQFYKDQEYTLDQFRIAEKHLNIVSQHETFDVEKVVDSRIKERDAEIAELKARVSKAEKEKPNMDKWFDDNMERIIKKFNECGVDMKIRNSKRV